MALSLCAPAVAVAQSVPLPTAPDSVVVAAAVMPAVVAPGLSASALDTLRPGDVIRLRVWREPDLSGDFIVDETGTVVFPKIGSQQVTSMAPAELKVSLLGAFRRYLRNPSIDVTLLRRVNVLGAVQRPGLYPVDPTMTIADALAMAGGVMPQGNPNKVHLLRGGTKLTTSLSARTKLTQSQLRAGDQIYVPERSWISRNTGVLTATISASASLIIALLIR